GQAKGAWGAWGEALGQESRARARRARRGSRPGRRGIPVVYAARGLGSGCLASGRETFVNSLPNMFQSDGLLSRLRASPEGGARHAGHLRQLNLGRILALVMDQSHPFTRAELIQATGLSAPTVGSLVAHLMRSGVVRDLGVGPSRGGRRPSLMDFNARY